MASLKLGHEQYSPTYFPTHVQQHPIISTVLPLTTVCTWQRNLLNCVTKRTTTLVDTLLSNIGLSFFGFSYKINKITTHVRTTSTLDLVSAAKPSVGFL